MDTSPTLPYCKFRLDVPRGSWRTFHSRILLDVGGLQQSDEARMAVLCQKGGEKTATDLLSNSSDEVLSDIMVK